MIRCAECNGTDVMLKAWLDPNTDEILEWSEDTVDSYCTDCSDNTRLRTDDTVK